MAANKNATTAEIYAVLNQLVEAYGNVMNTFQTVITDVGEIKGEMQELRGFVQHQFADAVTARNIWRNAAEAHKAEAEELRRQLKLLQDGHHGPAKN